MSIPVQRLLDRDFAIMAGSGVTGFEFLGSKFLGSAAVTTGALTIPARDFLFLMPRVMGYSGGGDIASLRFNADSGANYWSRYLSSAAGATTFSNNVNVSQALARMFATTTTLQRSALIGIINNAATSKVGNVSAQTSTGAAATSGIIETGGFEWINTTAQITSIEMLTSGGAVTMAAGSGFAVWGRNIS